jgi:hypothetical protein
MRRLSKKPELDFNSMSIEEYVKQKNIPTRLEKVIYKIDKYRAIDLLIKHFDGQGKAFFGKTDDVLEDIKKLVASTGVDNPEEVMDSMFEDWERDKLLNLPFVFIEMNDEGVNKIEAYYFDDIDCMVDDIEDYLNVPAIVDEVNG